MNWSQWLDLCTASFQYLLIAGGFAAGFFVHIGYEFMQRLAKAVIYD